mgnify:CR=1 FL=1
MYLEKTVFLIVGVSRSGTGITELLLKRGAKCYVYDDNENDRVKATMSELEDKGAVIVGKSEVFALLRKIDIVVLSPGVAIDHEIPLSAKKLGKKVTGELELASEFCLSSIIAVTGTNGKTTTCTMIKTVLDGAGIKSELCGNIGTPLSTVIDKLTPETVVVAEVSSFQLETVRSFTPHIAVITNITPDHLSRHYNMENYVFVKSKILLNLTESEYAVLSYDDQTVRSLSEKTRGKVVYFSLKEEVNGAYVSEEKIFYKGKYIIDIADLPVSGEHNVYNVLACVCVAMIMGVDVETLVTSLKSFKGVKHRIQFVRNVDGVDYYNDSKATNIDATIKAVASMTKPTVLIVGGKDKGLDFDKLFEGIDGSEVKAVVATGESEYRIVESAKKTGYKNISMTPDFNVAVCLAKKLAKAGETVLLSPACSSFDSFTDFEQRGDTFINLVDGFSDGE